MNAHLGGLNRAQREAVTHCGPEPLLIVAGAGSGKTHTLAHRVAHLILQGADPGRVLLLTFTRRAAAEMSRRAEEIVTQATRGARHGGSRIAWSGTFHAVANRLLRLFAHAVQLDPGFTVLDRSDSADLMAVLRSDLGFASSKRRFPKKSTCLAIYSRAVNAREDVERALDVYFPWCREWATELRELFRAYVERKGDQSLLDYDDLLLYWYYLMQDPDLREQVGALFDCVLVDEYQDTNALQAEVLRALRPSGNGVTVVGDDAQSIYGFRAATVRNILDFPRSFSVPGRVVTLEQSYRSTQPILAAANAVIGEATEQYCKQLFSTRESQQLPILATVEDEGAQVDYVIERVLAAREAGTPLQRQAVLFRTAHHSDALEVELGRRNIPYVKYGGLRFLEAAHVKDLVCILRWAENPRDSIAAFRVLQLMPGIGPALARRVLEHFAGADHRFDTLSECTVPAAARHHWTLLCSLLVALTKMEWSDQVRAVRVWYDPIVAERYEAAAARQGDLDQLEQIAGSYRSREQFLSELTLDPPEASGEQAGAPLLDEDYLVLSTIHSAKGQEWNAVYVLNLADGCIPSDMATGDHEQIEEERRLLYVAMTRARDELHLVHPLRFFVRQQHRHGDRHLYSPLSRFLPDHVLDRFERVGRSRRELGTGAEIATSARVDVRAKLRELF